VVCYSVVKCLKCCLIVIAYRSFSSEVEKGQQLAGALTDRLMSVICPAALMEDTGYSCCSSAPKFQTFLSKFLPLKEEHLAKMLVLLSRTDKRLGANIGLQEYSTGEQFGSLDRSETPVATSWNLDVFIEVLRSLTLNVSAVHWHSVL
jgi:hypothetical protein